MAILAFSANNKLVATESKEAPNSYHLSVKTPPILGGVFITTPAVSLVL